LRGTTIDSRKRPRYLNYRQQSIKRYEDETIAKTKAP
jgi:hypothetical protein